MLNLQGPMRSIFFARKGCKCPFCEKNNYILWVGYRSTTSWTYMKGPDIGSCLWSVSQHLFLNILERLS